MRACAALCSLQEINPTLDLFIAGNNFSNGTIQALSEHNVSYINIKSDDFYMVSNSAYNIESYFYFAMPEMLLDMGYKKSIYIDGDIIALKNFDSGFCHDKAFSGSAFSKVTYNYILKDKIFLTTIYTRA